jgi:hypothetical protein
MYYTFMEHITYILFSGIKNRYYIGLGSSSNIGSVVKVGGYAKSLDNLNKKKKTRKKLLNSLTSFLCLLFRLPALSQSIL